MVLFFTTTLGLSIAGMIMLLALKRYELNSGRFLLGSARPRVGEFFHRTLMWFERDLPLFAGHITRVILYGTQKLFWMAVAQAVIAVEYTLEKVLHVVKEKTSPQRPEGEASAFLRQVSEHKKKLQRRAPARRTIVHSVIKEDAAIEEDQE